jgi:hypothetical protein
MGVDGIINDDDWGGGGNFENNRKGLQMLLDHIL